jgi:undecaprenyl diphosphate synthase
MDGKQEPPVADHETIPGDLPLILPNHVACIMDGNGRWARARGLNRIDGHAAGEKSILDFVDTALEYKIGWITLFAFSTENWSRPGPEVSFLMEFNKNLILRHGQRFHNQGVRVRYLGSDDPRIPRSLWRQMRGIEELTSNNSQMTLTIAFNHGGRSEITEAVQQIVRDGVPEGEVSEMLISKYLSYADMPDPDIVIRTAGESRLSNFVLWRCAYSELVFMDVLWPDFSRVHFAAALSEYSKRTRKFGRVVEPGSNGLH